MNDLQNVVGRLDDLLMLFWVVGAMLIFAVALVSISLPSKIFYLRRLLNRKLNSRPLYLALVPLLLVAIILYPSS
jgi:hypothetical protein